MLIPAFLSPTTVIIVLIVALLVFGPHKLPELARQIGAALRELRKMQSEVQNVFDVHDHISYDRYDPPGYTYTPPSYEPLDQYHAPEEPEHPEALEAPVEPEAEPEKPKRKRAPRKKKTEESAPASEETGTLPLLSNQETEKEKP